MTNHLEHPAVEVVADNLQKVKVRVVGENNVKVVHDCVGKRQRDKDEEVHIF